MSHLVIGSLQLAWTIPVSSLYAIDDEYAFHRFVGKYTTFVLRKSVWQGFEKLVKKDVLDSTETGKIQII